MTKDLQKQLDALFGSPEDLQNSLQELKAQCEEENTISTHNSKSVLGENEISNINTVELNQTTNDANQDELISSKNSERALPDELSTEDNMLISTHNSDNALPDEHAQIEEVPISTQNAEVMHENELIAEQPISTHNSSKFVGEQ